MPEAVFWCLVVCLFIAVVLTVRQRHIATLLRRRVTALDNELRAHESEILRLIRDRLPAVTDAQEGRPVPEPGPCNKELSSSGFAQSLDTVVELFSSAIDKTRGHSDESARASLVAAMRTLQALTNEQQSAISRMQARHDSPEVLEDLLVIDHANSQIGRRAQAIAVLCGAWPGRQRSVTPLAEVARGATSRIRDYLRVQIQTRADIGVKGRSVEPVVLAVAELLDNAARHSQPHTTVQVNIQEVHNGAVLVIDDAGVGMNKQEILRASQVLSGQQPVDVTRLGDPPQFGLPVVAVLADRYNFRVSIDSQSPYGGVRVVVFLPTELLTAVEEPAFSAPATSAPDHHAEGTSTTVSLPKRRRWQPTEQTAAAAQSDPPMASSRLAQDAATLMGALQRGTRSGRAANQAVPAEPAEQSDRRE